MMQEHLQSQNNWAIAAPYLCLSPVFPDPSHLFSSFSLLLRRRRRDACVEGVVHSWRTWARLRCGWLWGGSGCVWLCLVKKKKNLTLFDNNTETSVFAFPVRNTNLRSFCCAFCPFRSSLGLSPCPSSSYFSCSSSFSWTCVCCRSHRWRAPRPPAHLQMKSCRPPGLLHSDLRPEYY